MTPEEPKSQMSLVERGKAWWAVIARSRPYRAYERYTEERASLLAGGIAYVSLMTVGLALVVGFTIMNSVIAGNDALKLAVIDSVAEQLPGLLAVDGKEGLVEPESLFKTNFLSVAGLTSLAIALFSGAGWLNAVRQGIRAVWRLKPLEDNFVLKKLRDIGIMATIGLLVVASAALSLMVNAAAGPLLHLVGLADTGAGAFALRAVSVLVVLAVDTTMMIVLFRLLTGTKLPWHTLFQGALIGGIGFGLLKMFAGTLLGNVGGNNPVLASSAVLAGLAIWLNFNARITLLSAAWAAESAADAGAIETGAVSNVVDVRDFVEPDYSHPIGPMPPQPVPVGRRIRDTVSLATGVVIGAVFLSGVRAMGRLRGDSNNDEH